MLVMTRIGWPLLSSTTETTGRTTASSGVDPEATGRVEMIGGVATSSTGLAVPAVELRASTQVAVIPVTKMNSGWALGVLEIGAPLPVIRKRSIAYLARTWPRCRWGACHQGVG